MMRIGRLWSLARDVDTERHDAEVRVVVNGEEYCLSERLVYDGGRYYLHTDDDLPVHSVRVRG